MLKACFLSLIQVSGEQGGLLSGRGEHQGLFIFLSAKDVRQHEGGEEAELHSEAELKQLQVDAEHPLKHSWQEVVNVVSLHNQNGVWRWRWRTKATLQKPHRLCVCLQLPDCKRLAELNLMKDTADGDDDLKYSGDDA